MERGKTMNRELRISVDIPESYQNKIREAYQSYKKTYNDILNGVGNIGKVEILGSKKLYENFHISVRSKLFLIPKFESHSN